MSIHHRNTLDIDDISKILSQRAFGTMVKPVGSLCNLNCAYCYYLHRENESEVPLSKSHSIMPESLLEEYIRQYISAQQVDTVTFCWHGGEPTLAGTEYYKKAIELQKRYSQGKKIINTFQTNGTLIDEHWCDFFKENDILVGLSIDGPAGIHDRNRVWTNGKSSLSSALDAAKLFHRKGVEFNTLTTVNHQNEGKGAEVYLFLRDIVGSHFMQFLPVAEVIRNSHSVKIAPYSVKPHGYGEFLMDIFDLWVEKDVGNVFVQIFDTTLALWCGYNAGVCTLGEYCSDSLTIESNGDVFPCDHFAFEQFKLGNITRQTLSEIFDSPKRVEFSLAKKKELPTDCLKCKYLFACHGECPQHRFPTDGDTPAKNYLCSGLKNYFEYVEPYMNYMKMLLERNLPPAQIIYVAKQLKKQYPRTTTTL